MEGETSPTSPSKAAYWAGWALSVLSMPLFALSAYMKFSGAPEVIKGFEGWPANIALVLGVVETACILLYLVPQTAVLGAVLFTGYLGGAMATHVRLGESVIVHIVLGVLIWLGLFLRDPRIRALLPLRRPIAPPH